MRGKQIVYVQIKMQYGFILYAIKLTASFINNSQQQPMYKLSLVRNCFSLLISYG